MKPLCKRLLATGLLAGAGLAFAQAQPAPVTPMPPSGPMAGHMGEHRMGHGDPAQFQQHMAARHARHMTVLKALLKLSPAQEGAWTSFAAAMQPPANLGALRASMAEMPRLTTPERIDRLQALKTQRDAEMAKRADAAKAFYAQLTPEQKKVFDDETLRFFSRSMHRHFGQGHGGPGGMGGPGMGMGPR